MTDWPPVPPTDDRLTAVAYALAADYPRIRHGQLCPVVTQNTGLDHCQCWRMKNALAAARGAIKALETFDAMSVSVEHPAR